MAIDKTSIIGVFEGECADARITNNNGLDIVDDVWKVLFDSDTFKTGLKNGWYIGFLGHPVEPDCMDYRNACIVMTAGGIREDGKVWGKFNLIDTPVGRIVKTFIDAGVRFGISVRGAGDVIDNSVTPGTFDFRGFDLVSFPAFPESIPKFRAIAASTDTKLQQKYRIMCTTLKDNLADISDVHALNELQPLFAPQSDEYAMIEDRKHLLADPNLSDLTNIQVKSLIQLYTDLKLKYDDLQKRYDDLQLVCNNHTIQSAKRLNTIRRIYSDHNCTVIKQQAAIKASADKLLAQNQELQQSNDRLTQKINQSERKYSRIKASYVEAKTEIKRLEDLNLKYNMKIQSSSDIIKRQSNQLSKLDAKLKETVQKTSVQASTTSNLDATTQRLRKQLSDTQNQLKEYQLAYGELYAAAIGASLNKNMITASTSVCDLQQMLTNHSSVTYPADESPSDIIINDSSLDGLVTL